MILVMMYLGWQLQGGPRQTIQITQPVSHVQGSSQVLQGNSEDGDNLQHAMGYNALNWKLTNPVNELKWSDVLKDFNNGSLRKD